MRDLLLQFGKKSSPLLRLFAAQGFERNKDFSHPLFKEDLSPILTKGFFHWFSRVLEGAEIAFESKFFL